MWCGAVREAGTLVSIVKMAGDVAIAEVIVVVGFDLEI